MVAADSAARTSGRPGSRADVDSATDCGAAGSAGTPRVVAIDPPSLPYDLPVAPARSIQGIGRHRGRIEPEDGSAVSLVRLRARLRIGSSRVRTPGGRALTPALSQRERGRECIPVLPVTGRTPNPDSQTRSQWWLRLRPASTRA